MSAARLNVPSPWLTIRTLFAHHDWARDKLLSVAATLSDAQLDAGVAMGFGSLRDTLFHLWAAESLWLQRWKRLPNPKFPEHDPRLSIDDLGKRWRATDTERDDLLLNLDPDALEQPLTYAHPDGRSYTQQLSDLMIHVCNHAAHHRAQALNMLRRCGAATPGLDFLFMKLEQPPFLRSAPLDVPTLTRFFSYSDWADERFFNAAASLDAAALARPFEIGPGSIARTLAHLAEVHGWWCDAWNPRAAEAPFPSVPADWPLEAYRERFAALAARRNAFLAGASAEDLQRSVRARSTERRLEFLLGDTLLQVCLHGTHHRAQLANMLRQLQVTPPRLDFVVWRREIEGQA